MYVFSERRPLLKALHHGGLGWQRNKPDAWNHHTFLLGERTCTSCCLASSARKRRANLAPGAFLDKSSFPLHSNRLRGVQPPRATVGPDEPHAASTTWPEGIAEKQELGLFDSELVERVEEFLGAELPSHPKLHRGQLKNGLRYLILPNKVPPNR